MRFLQILPLLALTFCFGGCAGYTVGPVKPATFKAIHTVAVPSFKNETLQPRVEVLLANSLIKQIQQDGTYSVVSENNADAIIEGTLEKIVRRPARSVSGNILQTQEFNLILEVDCKVLDRKTGKELLRRKVSGTTSYFVSGSSTIAADLTQDEQAAIPLAAEDLCVRLVSQISEGW